MTSDTQINQPDLERTLKLMAHEQIAENLKERGIPVEYILFPDEGHGWKKIPNRIRSTAAIVNWFEKYLKV